MKLQFFCPHWGSEHLSWELFIKKVKDFGYDGIEWGIHAGTTEKEVNDVYTLITKNNLAIILQHWDTLDSDYDQHLNTYQTWLTRVAALPAVKINSQTGKDYFTRAQNLALMKVAAEHMLKTGIPVVHETHRGKSLFAAHVAADYFRELPSLRITLDLSHWVTVAESLLADQEDVLKIAFERTDHLHARIGHTQGPQVSDPRLPQWGKMNEIFFHWWDQLIETKKKNGSPELSITTEFGPYPYMSLLPSGKPVADQWDLNSYMLEEFRRRYTTIA